MKKWIFILSLWSLSLFARAPLLDNEGKPNPALQVLLDRFEIKGDLVEETQKKWLRKKGVERWECDYLPDPNLEESFLLFKELGLVDEIKPSKKEYDYIGVCGATTSRVIRRLQYLNKLWGEKVRAQSLVFLTGERFLDPKVDLFPPFFNNEADLPETETEMMVFIFNHLDLPSELRMLPLTVADAKRPPHEKRPQTPHSYEAWLLMNPKRGSLLLISDQPFIPRMTAQGVKILVPAHFTVEGAGPALSFEEYCQNPKAYGVYLDELARLIYVLKG